MRTCFSNSFFFIPSSYHRLEKAHVAVIPTAPCATLATPLAYGILKEVEHYQTNKTFMNKDFEPGSILNPRDYIKKYDRLTTALGVLVSFLIVFVGYIAPLLK
jgi:hypothetical protein